MADTHRPDTFILVKPTETVPAPAEPPLHPARGLVLRRFRPAWPVQVTLADERPAALAGGLTGAIRQAHGPWRTDGDWWRPGGWAVETWHVELTDGAAYQLARTPVGWHLEGVFD